jgi:hypothetical protein
MGFFSSSSESTVDQKNTYQNDVLDQYTKAYRNAAPWGFATLDPTATLAAMGKGTKLGNKDLGANFKDYLSGLSGDEKKQAGQTQEALQRIQQRQESGQFLTPQETDFINTSLDKAFEYANTTGMRDITLQAQTMAGRQGLRTSDTPIAQPAMNATRDLALGLGSQRAQLGLNATLQTGAQQNAFDQSFAEFQQNLQMSRQNSRNSFLFGGGLSGASNVGYTQTSQMRGKQTSSPSTMSNIMQTTQALSGIMDLGQKVGGAFMGMPSLPSGGGGYGGGGGGGSANYGSTNFF